jgi:hypothetical protein
MIDPGIFTVPRILATLIDERAHGWRRDAEIVQEERGGRQIWVVRIDKWFLRYSQGPHQCHFWDVYGEDYQSPELALLALLQAPAPPSRVTWPGREEAA